MNGELAFTGRNIAGFPAASVADERISLENGSFPLQLRKGRNEVAIALDDNLPGNIQHFGWGFELKLHSLRDIQISTSTPPSDTGAEVASRAEKKRQ